MLSSVAQTVNVGVLGMEGRVQDLTASMDKGVVPGLFARSVGERGGLDS